MPDQEMPVLSMPARLRRDTQSSPCLPTHATAVPATPRRSRPAGPRHCNLAVPAMPRNLTIRAKPAIPGRAVPEHSNLALPAPPMRARPCPSLRRHACPANPDVPGQSAPFRPCHAYLYGSSRPRVVMPALPVWASPSPPCQPATPRHVSLAFPAGPLLTEPSHACHACHEQRNHA